VNSRATATRAFILLDGLLPSEAMRQTDMEIVEPTPDSRTDFQKHKSAGFRVVGDRAV
jgi:hypothetical protein